MNLLYIVNFDITDVKMLGVRKKIDGQIKSFKKLNADVDMLWCNDNKIFLNGDSFETKKGLSNYRHSIYLWLIKNIKKYDYIYYRLPDVLDINMINIIKLCNKNNVELILEIPTYPLKGEFKLVLFNYIKKGKIIHFLFHSLKYFIHIIISKIIYKWHFNIVTFMPYSNIWNVGTIIIDNGVDTDSEKVVLHKSNNKEIIKLIVVANISLWHGIDRLLYGLQKYVESGKENVFLTVVGEGNYLDELKKICLDCNLQKYVTFQGKTYGDKLNQLYQECDIAVASLGMHRIGVINGSTLKTKEYCSKGIPFIYAYNEKVFNGFDYALKFDADDSPIDINKICAFYSSISKIDDYQDKMHDYAKRNLDWNVQMKKVLKKIQEKDGKHES